MSTSPPRARLTLALAVSLLVTTTAGADVTLKQKTTTSGMGGMGGGSATSIMVVSGDRSRTDDETSFGDVTRHVTRITRLDRGVIWTIHDDRKEYSEVTFADVRRQLTDVGADSTLDSLVIEVKRTGKTDTVNGFAAVQAMVTSSAPLPVGGPIEGSVAITADVWMSKAVPGGDELRAFVRAFVEKAGVDPMSQRMGRLARMFGGSMQRVANELQKLDGVPVSLSMRVELKTPDGDAKGPGGIGPMSVTTELLSASADKVTASFDVPAGYKKVEERGFGGMGPGPGGRSGRGAERHPGGAGR